MPCRPRPSLGSLLQKLRPRQLPQQQGTQSESRARVACQEVPQFRLQYVCCCVHCIEALQQVRVFDIRSDCRAASVTGQQPGHVQGSRASTSKSANSDSTSQAPGACGGDETSLMDRLAGVAACLTPKMILQPAPLPGFPSPHALHPL